MSPLILVFLENFSKIIYMGYKLTSPKDFFKEGKDDTDSVISTLLPGTNEYFSIQTVQK